MKYFIPFFIFTFSAILCSGQEKVSDVEQIISPDILYYGIDYRYFHYDNVQYALFHDKEHLELINIEDESDPGLTYKIQIECFKYLEENNELLVIDDKIYLIRKAQIQEFNLKQSGETSVFAFDELTFPREVFHFGEHYIVGYQGNNNELTVELIDLRDKVSTVWKYGDYELVQNINEHLVAVSDERDQVVLFDTENGGITILHQGENIILTNNIFRSASDVVFLDKEKELYTIDLETMGKEMVCTINGHSPNAYILNSEQYIYYSAIPEGFTDYMFFGISKTTCEVEFFEEGENPTIVGYHQLNGETYTVVEVLGKLYVIDEKMGVRFMKESAYYSGKKFKIVDDALLVFTKDTSGFDTYRIENYNFLTHSFKYDVFYMPGYGGRMNMGQINGNELIALADYNDQSSVVKLSFDVDSISATPFLKEKDYGLRPYAWWKKHGKSLSTEAYHRSDDLVVVMDDEVKKISPPNFVDGYYVWDNTIAGIVNKGGDLIFTIYDTETETIVDELFTGTYSGRNYHNICKIGDEYYELIYDHMRKRYPESSEEAAFDGQFLQGNRIKLESKVITSAGSNGFTTTDLFLISEEGIEPILTNLPRYDYYEIEINGHFGSRRVMLYRDNQKDETIMLGFDSETGELLLNKTLEGRRRFNYFLTGYDGWITIMFENQADVEYNVCTNGKDVQVFEPFFVGLEPDQSSIRKYTNDHLILKDDNLNIVALDKEGHITESSGNLKFDNRLYDVLYDQEKYYFLTQDFQGINLTRTNENLETEDVLLSIDDNRCESWEPEFLGKGPGIKGNIYFTLNTNENGKEIWYIDLIDNQAKLLQDINGYTSSSFEYKEFYHDGAVYFKASDSTGNVQLYKLPLGSPTVNTEEVGERKMQTLTIYPNPTEERISFDIILVQLVIRDITGKIVRSEFLKSGIKTLRINELKAGIYFIEGYDEEGNKYIQKFVKV